MGHSYTANSSQLKQYDVKVSPTTHIYTYKPYRLFRLLFVYTVLTLPLYVIMKLKTDDTSIGIRARHDL